MLKKINVMISICTTVFAGTTCAQSAFEGFYGQLSTGYEHNSVNSAKLTGTDYGGLPNVSTSASPSGDSMPLVFGLGYTMAVSEKVTLGLGFDYAPITQSTNSAGFSYPSTGNTSSYDYKFSVSNRFNLFLAPGYVIDPNKLAYLKLGYSNQSVQYQQTNCCSNPSNDASVGGYLLGIGYKQMINDGLYLFVEANYYAYQSANLSSTYSDGPGGTVTADPDLSTYNFLIGVGYKF